MDGEAAQLKSRVTLEWGPDQQDTLARVKDIDRRAAREARGIVSDARPPDATSLVTRVTLFRSHLSPKGSRYEPLAHGELSGTSA